MRLRTLAFGLLLFTAEVSGQKKQGYNIIGNINGLPDGISFYLITSKPNGSADTLSTVKSNKQQFSFEGALPLEAELRFVKMDTTVLKLKKDESGAKRQSWIRILLDNSTVHLTGDIEQWPKINIKGSIPTDEHNRFTAAISSPTKEYMEEINSDNQDSSRLSLAQIKYNQSYTKAFEVIPGSYAIPLFILNNRLFTLDEKEAAYNKLPKKLKDSFYGLKLKQMNELQRASE